MFGSKNNFNSFDDILNVVGSYGWFQKRFCMIFVLLVTFLGSQTYFSYVVVLTTPDHWCKVPGRNLTDYTVQEWKDLTIPKKLNEWGKEIYYNCQMYNVTQQEVNGNVSENSKIIDCQHGWEYNTTWYTETVVSRENWVCGKDVYGPNIIAFTRISEVFGSLMGSYLGDVYGRKSTYLLTFLILIIGRICLLFTSGTFSLYLTASVFGGFASVNMLISALVNGMEISDEKHRGFIMLLQTCGWGFGMSVMGLIMWVVGDWQYYLLATTIPSLLSLLFIRYMVESPRWLMSQGKISKCMKELGKIAKTNRRKLPEDIATDLTSLSKMKVKNYGILSFFSQWRLAKNTICLNVSWAATGVSYLTLVLYFGQYGTNPFITSFLQGIVEIPANIVGMIGCNYIGRRWTHALSHLGTTLGSLTLIFVMNNPDLEWLSTTLTIFLRFTVAFSIYVVFLHTIEIYPTCLRQSGMSLGNLITNVFSVLGPYVVYLGTTVDSRFPLVVLFSVALVASCSVSLLPETLHNVLPESLEDAKEFGCSQSYWSWPKKLKEFQLVKSSN